MHAYYINNLKPDTTYKIWVKVKDQAGNEALYTPETYTTPINRDEVKEYIELTTKNSTVTLTIITANQEDRKWVWIDLNGNKKWDKDIDVPATLGEDTYSLKAGTFRIYGKVTYLYCNGNDISAIALHNPYLQDLSAGTNELQSVNIPNSDNLTTLYLDKNPLTSLKLGKLPYLKKLEVEVTQLSTLALGSCPELERLVVSNTPITHLDVSANTKLNLVSIGRYNGKGLIDAALKDFVKSLHSNGGEIYLSKDQKTPEILKDLKDKKWTVK